MRGSSSIWSRLRRFFGGKETALLSPETVAGTAPTAEPDRSHPPVPNAAPAALGEESPVPRPRVTTVAAPSVDLVLGIDLGTSCTKVVIGDPGWQDKAFAVSFGRADTGISGWFHSTRLGPEANLKMRLMDNPAAEHVRDLLACYLAGVITRSRAWFDSNRPAEYRHREIRWSLNLGFPGKAVGTTSLSQAYRSIATIAFALAFRSEIPSLELAANIRRHGPEVEPFIPSPRIQVYPEIAAQLAGYVNSPYRHPGNLLLIDIGAGTLDVSTIILHGNDHQDVVSFHFCEVALLGALRLYEARANALENVQPGCVTYHLDHFQDGLLPVPESLREMVNHSSAALDGGFRRISAEFADKVVRVALACLTRFRMSQREAHSSASFDPWGNTLRFFLTGGGCRSAFYRDQLANGRLEDQLAIYTRWHREAHRRRTDRQGLRLESLPLPSNLKNFPPELRHDFDRLSVAYGLAYGGENLMQITTSIHS